MPIIREIYSCLHQFAPYPLQESYDNSGLLVGNMDSAVTGILISLDVTEKVLQEAIDCQCNLIISHHPILFQGIKKLNGNNYVERILIKAIKHDIALMAIHTNLDNVLMGVNNKIAETLGLQKIKVLKPLPHTIQQLYVYVPETGVSDVKQAMYNAGAGEIGHYDSCSFEYHGLGNYRPLAGAQPFAGEVNMLHTEKEVKIEVIVARHLIPMVVEAMKKAHPYEEVAFGVLNLENSDTNIGAGVLAELPEAMVEHDFLTRIQQCMKCSVIRHTALRNKLISKVAICGGSGSFLLPEAIKAKADIFITADFKYHQFFDADGQIVIADIGHYETEQFTGEIIYDLLSKKYPTFALQITSVNTNPVHYFK